MKQIQKEIQEIVGVLGLSEYIFIRKVVKMRYRESQQDREKAANDSFFKQVVSRLKGEQSSHGAFELIKSVYLMQRRESKEARICIDILWSLFRIINRDIPGDVIDGKSGEDITLVSSPDGVQAIRGTGFPGSLSVEMSPEFKDGLKKIELETGIKGHDVLKAILKQTGAKVQE